MSLRVRILVGLVLACCACVRPPAEQPAEPESAPADSGNEAGRLPGKLTVLWKFSARDSFDGAVAVSAGTVYAGSMDGHVYALGLADGKKKWAYAAGPKDPAPFRAAPVIKKGLVYVGDLDGGLHCISAAGGKRKWLFSGAGGELGGVNFHGDDILVGSRDEHLYCVSKDGKERWKFKIDGPIYGSASVAGGYAFLAGCDSQLHVIDVAKGKAVRSVDLGIQSAATAVVSGDRLYVGLRSGEVKAIDWKKGKVVWTYRPARRDEIRSSAALTDKFVILGSRDKKVHCIDRKTGQGVWKFPTGNQVDSSPVVAGKSVVFGSLDKKLYVLNLATGKEVQRLTLDDEIVASPVLVAGRVLIGTRKGTLYCLGAAKK